VATLDPFLEEGLERRQMLYTAAADPRNIIHNVITCYQIVLNLKTE
jgi:hypothetical protein